MRRIHHDTLDSTNDEARRLLSRYPGETLLVTASQQTAGRGRRGRTWHAPRGGVWLSLAWPTAREPAWYEPAPLVAALATWRAVARYLDPGDESRLRVKWPNDLLLDGRKIAGILCEQALEHASLVVGVGVNANLAVNALPSKLRQPVTTLREALGAAVDVPALIRAIADALTTALTDLDRHGFTNDTRQAVEQRLAFRGERVSLHVPPHGTPRSFGIVQGLAPNGGLTLHVAGQRETFTIGEVQQVKSS